MLRHYERAWLAKDLFAGLYVSIAALVPVIGSLPQGLAVPREPVVSLAELRALLPGAVAVALISLADISVLSRILAAPRSPKPPARGRSSPARLPL
ncbi:hypothetical protein ACU4GI_12300 [Cupriavidus basilensis]